MNLNGNTKRNIKRKQRRPPYFSEMCRKHGLHDIDDLPRESTARLRSIMRHSGYMPARTMAYGTLINRRTKRS